MSDETRDQIVASMMSYMDATDFATKSWLHELIADFEDHFDTIYQRKAEESKCPVCGDRLLPVAFPNYSECRPENTKICSQDKAWGYCCGAVPRGDFPPTDACRTIHWSRDSRGLYIRQRYSAPDKSLVVDFWLRDKLLEMKVVEQDERWRSSGDEIRIIEKDNRVVCSFHNPSFAAYILWTRGTNAGADNELSSWLTPTSTRAALDAMLEWGKLIESVKLPEEKPKPRHEPKVGMMVDTPRAIWSGGPYRIAGQLDGPRLGLLSPDAEAECGRMRQSAASAF